MDLPDQIGRFRVRRVLGRGAMGVVYLAQDPVLGRDVAIKTIRLHPGLSEQQIVELRQRFETEARAAAKLAHPSLVTIFDAGLEGENLYIAMEFVEGEGLDALVESGRRLSPEELSELLSQLASALDYAHEQGIVHRDIKPANVLINRRGLAKITDFGVARQAASTLTATGAMIGTPAYMSPEQITGAAVSGASDQFSLAIMFYELITGERPFVGEGATTILYKIVHEEPAEPNAVRPDLTPALDAAVLRAMSKSPAERFPTCSEFARAVSAGLGLVADAAVAPSTLASPLPSVPNELATDPDAATVLDASTGGTSQRLRPPQPASVSRGAEVGDEKKPPWVLIGGVAAMLLAVVMVWASIRGGSGGEPDTSQSAPIDPPVEMPLTTAESPDSLPLAPIGGDLESRSAAAPAALATYRISSRPSGARVMLDGELLADSTPIEVQIATDVEHTLLLEMADYSAVSWRFIPDELPEEQQVSGQLFFPLRSSAEGQATVDAAVAATEIVTSDGVSARQEDLPPVDPIRVRGSMQPPDVVQRGDNPLMPAWAIELGLQRYVILELVIDRKGRVRDARPLQAVHPELESMAIAAVWLWTFEPAERNGEPVDVYHNVSVQFMLPDENRLE